MPQPARSKSSRRAGCTARVYRTGALARLVAGGPAGQFQRVAADAFVGEADDEARSFARSALDFDLAVVRLDDPGDKAEAEAESLFGRWRRALAGDAVEAVEDMRQVLGGNAAAVVLHH